MKKIFVIFAFLLLFNNLLSACCLTRVQTIPFAPNTRPEFVAYRPDGSCLAVTNAATNTISVFSVDSLTCNLTQVGAPVSSGGTTPLILAYSPNGQCLAVANIASNNVVTFRVNPDCSLTFAGSSNTGSQPVGVTFSLNGDCLIVSNSAGSSLSVFEVNDDCTLTPIDTVNTASTPVTVQFSPDGQCLGVAHSTSPGTVTLFSFNEANCSLSAPVNFSSGGNSPEFLAFSPNGQCLAVANETSNNLAMFQTNNCSDPGAPTIYTTVDGVGQLPIVPAFSPNGECLALSNGIDNTISTFNVGDDCTLTAHPNSPTFSGGTFPFGLTYSPNSRCLTVANFRDPINPLDPANNLSVFSIFTVTITPASLSVCEGGTIELTANTFGGTGDPNFFNYDWTGPNGFTCIGNRAQCGTITIPNATQANAGAYTVTVSDTGEPGCSASAMAQVAVNPNPEVTITPDSLTICQSDTIILTANPTGGSGTYNFSWSGPAGFVSSNQSISIPNAQLENGGVYTVVVTDSNGCQATDSATVTINPSPVVTIEPEFLIICQGQTIELTANPTGGSGIYTSFIWTGPNGFVSNEQTIIIPNAAQTDGGIYTVTVTDSNGCQGTAEALVFVGAIQASDETFTTCINQPITILARGLQANARIAFFPALIARLAPIAREIFAPVLSGITVELVRRPSFGTVTINDTGSFTYTPALNFIGEDSFIVRIVTNGDCSTSDLATITIKVNQCCTL